ncbi:MAG: Gfo/Idh/MocA family oxidoreductase [Candidatus Handelsmanbacteria bacterium]|nr:Gfo/Idh/MocA family oxidoreductase [Candidatus Handelsmanbacteria bacterium]
MDNYRVALIGTGRVGYQFNFGELPDNHAEAVHAHPACQLVAGVNRGREKLDAFGQRFGVQALYHEYRQMLAEVQPDLCIVATHPELHCEMVEGCAAAPSTRAIICEKPMALSLAECDRMLRACAARGILLQINHNRRWSPEWELGLRLLREGAIGELVHLYGFIDGGKPAPWWRSEHEGSLLHDFTHYFDLMDIYAGPVDWLCGLAEQRRRPWAVEDFSAAFIKFRSGASGALHSAELTEYADHAFELRGSTGLLRFVGEQVQFFQAERDVYEPESGFQWSSLKPRALDRPTPASTYVAALQELLDALEGKGKLRSDGKVGRRSLEMVMAVYQSQLDGNRPVHFPLESGPSPIKELRRRGWFAARNEETAP